MLRALRPASRALAARLHGLGCRTRRDPRRTHRRTDVLTAGGLLGGGGPLSVLRSHRPPARSRCFSAPPAPPPALPASAGTEHSTPIAPVNVRAPRPLSPPGSPRGPARRLPPRSLLDHPSPPIHLRSPAPISAQGTLLGSPCCPWGLRQPSTTSCLPLCDPRQTTLPGWPLLGSLPEPLQVPGLEQRASCAGGWGGGRRAWGNCQEPCLLRRSLRDGASEAHKPLPWGCVCVCIGRHNLVSPSFLPARQPSSLCASVPALPTERAMTSGHSCPAPYCGFRQILRRGLGGPKYPVQYFGEHLGKQASITALGSVHCPHPLLWTSRRSRSGAHHSDPHVTQARPAWPSEGHFWGELAARGVAPPARPLFPLGCWLCVIDR